MSGRSLVIPEHRPAMPRHVEPYRPRSTDPLVDAAWGGHLDVVADLLARGADPNVRDDRGTTPLSAAARQCHHEVMRALIAAGGDPHEMIDQGDSLLSLAAWRGNIEGVRMLLAAGADPNEEKVNPHRTILMQAAGAFSLQPDANLPKRTTIVRMLIEVGADVNAITPDGRTPLSASEGDDALVRLLLEAGAVIPSHRPGQEPLLVAVMGWGRLRPSQEEGILRLIAAGADIHSPDKYGITPLKQACNVGSRRIVAALLEAGARRVGVTGDPDTRPSPWDESLPELHLAARDGDPSIVRLLLRDGADVAEVDRTGRTPLYWAAHFGRDAAVRVLLDAGADPNAPSGRGLSPLRMAAFGGHTGCVAHLLAAGAEVDAATVGGVTALHLAALRHRDRVVASLLEAGADPNRGDGDGRPPLRWAFQDRAGSRRGERRTVRVVERLLAAGADPSAADSRGETALFDAARTDQPDAIRALVAAGADLNHVSRDGLTPILVVPFPRTREDATLAALIRAGARVDCHAPDGTTPLHRLLIEAAGPHEWNNYRSPWRSWRFRAAFERLIAAGAAVNRADHAGTTPFMLAAGIRNCDVLTPLLDAGADPTLRDQQGRTARDFLALAGPPLPPMPSDEQIRIQFLRAVLRNLRDKDGAAGREQRREIRRSYLRTIRERRARGESDV